RSVRRLHGAGPSACPCPCGRRVRRVRLLRRRRRCPRECSRLLRSPCLARPPVSIVVVMGVLPAVISAGTGPRGVFLNSDKQQSVRHLSANCQGSERTNPWPNGRPRKPRARRALHGKRPLPAVRPSAPLKGKPQEKSGLL